MPRQLLHLLAQHYRLGWSRTLLFVDALLLLTAAADIVRYRIHAGHWRAVLHAITCFDCTGWRDDWTALLTFIIFLAAVLPPLLTVVRVMLRRHLPKVLERSRRPGWIRFAHAAVCVAVAWFFVISTAMRRLSGTELAGSTQQLSFESGIYVLVTLSVFAQMNTWALMMGASAISLTFFNLLFGEGPPARLKQYLLRAELADLPYDLQPAGSRIPAVEENFRALWRRYQAIAEQPLQLNAWLQQECASAKRSIEQLLGDGSSNSWIELFSGATEALDAAVVASTPNRNILVCASTRPAVRSYLLAEANRRGDLCRTVDFAPDDFTLEWEKQRARILQEIDASTTVLIVGAVNWATGRRIPLSDLIEKARQQAGPALRVIVDGSDDTGNLRQIPMNAGWDSYVFSPEQWLLAPESCAVLLARQTIPLAPGRWTGESRQEAKVLLGLVAALQVIQRHTLDFFWRRSDRLRKEFYRGLPKSVQVLGSNSGMEHTLITVLRPAPTGDWRSDQADLLQAIVEQPSYVSLIELEPRIPWIRVAFPYYADLLELRRLCDFLAEITK